MADPMDIQTFGGVKVNMNDVKDTQVIKDPKTGKETFVINFKNSIQVQYPKQSDKNQPTISSSQNWLSTKTEINRIFGLELKDSRWRDEIILEGCRNCNIDTSKRDIGPSEADTPLWDECGDITRDFVLLKNDTDTGHTTYLSGNNRVIGEGTTVKEGWLGSRDINLGADEAHREGCRPEDLK